MRRMRVRRMMERMMTRMMTRRMARRMVGWVRTLECLSPHLLTLRDNDCLKGTGVGVMTMGAS